VAAKGYQHLFTSVLLMAVNIWMPTVGSGPFAQVVMQVKTWQMVRKCTGYGSGGGGGLRSFF